MPEAAPDSTFGAAHWSVLTFLAYTGIVLLLAVFSHRFLKGRSFLKEYFLGSRGLGVWALALTYAATSSSGGSFTGFPALIYEHGWILALWISSYMLVPAVCLGLLGKRVNQVARKTGAITLPDILRDRFDSPHIGVVISLLLTFFLGFNLVAQFKAGGLIVEELLGSVELFRGWAEHLEWIPDSLSFLGASSRPGSLYCMSLLFFSLAVVVYTAYGGFRAVVWTDVLQGVVMFVGILILLPLAISKAGGLENATRQLAEIQYVEIEVHAPALDGETGDESVQVPRGTRVRVERDGVTSVYRVDAAAEIARGSRGTLLVSLREGPPVEGHEEWSRLEGRRLEIELIAPEGSSGEGLPGVTGLRPQPALDLVHGPGPRSSGLPGFLPLGIALSFFIMWPITGAGQPGTLVRLMAFRSASVYRKAIFTATIYYSLIYLPLVVIFVCARVILPDLDQADRAMPALIRAVVTPALAGILLAAPFAAVMSTVDSFLLMISSSLVRDIYQRNVNPEASPGRIRRLTYATTLGVGLVITLAALSPPDFLQVLIVFSSEGLACCFLAPMVLSLYWKRSTIQGVYAAILAGFATVVSLYAVNWIGEGTMTPYYLLGVMPVVWGLLASFLAGIVVSLRGPAPDERLVRFYFHRDPGKGSAVSPEGGA